MTFDIILPTLGRPSLAAAIKSVLAQDHQDWELHIVEDGICIPDSIKFLDSRIRWYSLPEKLGGYGAFARNRGVRRSENEWIAYIDDDDVWLPHHLSSIYEFIKTEPSIDMVTTAGQSFRMRHKSPRSSKLVRRLGAVNTDDILTVGMAHTRELFEKTQKGWLPCDNHDHILWKEMLDLGGKAAITDTVTFEFKR